MQVVEKGLDAARFEDAVEPGFDAGTVGRGDALPQASGSGPKRRHEQTLQRFGFSLLQTLL